jgi:hypothetical protein
MAKLAEIDPEHADVYYRNAVAAEEKGSGSESSRVAVRLHQYALELRARKRDPEAERLLRRALDSAEMPGPTTRHHRSPERVGQPAPGRGNWMRRRNLCVQLCPFRREVRPKALS